MIDPTTVWIVIAGLGLGSYLLRFTFIGIVGDRPMPPWLMRHLRYAAVAILPGLVAPLVMWPAANGGAPEPARLMAAVVTIVVGGVTRNVIAAIVSGGATLYGMIYLMGS